MRAWLTEAALSSGGHGSARRRVAQALAASCGAASCQWKGAGGDPLRACLPPYGPFVTSDGYFRIQPRPVAVLPRVGVDAAP